MTLALVVAIPLAAAVAVALVGGRLGRRTLGITTAVALALSFGAAASMIASLRERPSLEAYIGPWLPLGGADLALVLDSGMLAVTLAITGVAALIALYSIAYLEHGRGLQRYFVAFSLLVAAMLIVVLGSNLLLIFAGWELAGVATYLLIGHHHDDPRAAASAMRAFCVERAGDAALLAGILLLFAEFHTVDLGQLGGLAVEHGSVGGIPLVAGSLLLIGALAKSAQLPVHRWLIEATAEMSTPVAALLQTTAVVGGVVLLMRLRSVLAPDVLHAAAIVGGVTALVAALAAVAQRDLRRILAWSTISQVGLMFVAAGLGALFAARFQLIAHALFKAVLILGAGSARRAAGDESDVTRYGGLIGSMRWTAAAFAIGTLGLAAIPPAAGFFGVAAIASASFDASDPLLTALVLLTVAAAAFAGVRTFVLIFIAPPSVSRSALRSPFDPPLAILAIAALLFGAVVNAGLPIGSGPADDAPLWLVMATFAIALVSASAAWLGYRHGPARAARIDRAMRWAAGGLGLDLVSGSAIARLAGAISRELEVGGERAGDGASRLSGSVAARLSALAGRAQPHGSGAQQALLLAGAVALLAYWTLGPR